MSQKKSTFSQIKVSSMSISINFTSNFDAEQSSKLYDFSWLFFLLEATQLYKLKCFAKGPFKNYLMCNDLPSSFHVIKSSHLIKRTSWTIKIATRMALAPIHASQTCFNMRDWNGLGKAFSYGAFTSFFSVERRFLVSWWIYNKFVVTTDRLTALPIMKKENVAKQRVEQKSD